MDDTRDRVRAQFGRAAAAYATSDVHARGDSLEILLALLDPQPGWSVVDVATGAGHTALAVAPRVARVVATDITPEMLAQAADLARDRGLANVTTQLADCEALPCEAASIDALTCRLAFHHFPRPEAALAEWARVLRPGGVVGFTDNVTVEDHPGAAFYNAFETLRDPSHHAVLPLSRLVTLFEQAGLHVEATRTFAKEFAFTPWADRMHVSADDRATLLGMLRAVPASLRPLLAPRFAADDACFSLWETVLIARRLA